MKSPVMLLLALAAARAQQAPLQFYHSTAGIKEAARIKQYEQALDFGSSSRIVGGQTVNAQTHPYLGGIIIILTNGNDSVCGSSLLRNTRSITAAHCWYDGEDQASQFTVVLGSTRLYTGGTRINTTSVEVHQDFNFRNLNNDVAIITHARVTYTSTINRIPLPSTNSSFVGEQATAAGFGRIGDNVSISQNQEKREVIMPVISNAACAEYYRSEFVLASTLCTSGAGGRGTCLGDSGGPLTVGTGRNIVLIGVTSFVPKYEGCERGRPIGFTRITSFSTWIRERL